MKRGWLGYCFLLNLNILINLMLSFDLFYPILSFLYLYLYLLVAKYTAVSVILILITTCTFFTLTLTLTCTPAIHIYNYSTILYSTLPFRYLVLQPTAHIAGLVAIITPSISFLVAILSLSQPFILLLPDTLFFQSILLAFHQTQFSSLLVLFPSSPVVPVSSSLSLHVPLLYTLLLSSVLLSSHLFPSPLLYSPLLSLSLDVRGHAEWGG